MHKYLNSIGFSDYIHTCDINKLLNEVHENPDTIEVSDLLDTTFVTMEKDFAPGVGIGIFGEYDKSGMFDIEYYYPYCHGRIVSSTRPISISRRMDRYAFAAMYEDWRISISLIFYLQNINGYLDLVEKDKKDLLIDAVPISLVGLCSSGKILLPLQKTDKAREKAVVASRKRESLAQSAHEGDPEAMEKLALQEISAMQRAVSRSRSEDIYSIIDTFLMPSGMECDIYTLLGEITNVEELENSYSKERMYRLSLICNDIPMDVIVNEAKLLGHPEVGYRFKGDVWLQGRVQFPEV